MIASSFNLLAVIFQLDDIVGPVPSVWAIELYHLLIHLLLAGWNMLYFLWGVFRETRVHYIDSTRKLDVPGLNDVSLDNDTPTVMALSKNLHVPEHIGAADRLSGAASASKSPEPVVLTVSKDLESKDTYLEEMCFGSKENLVLQDSRVDSEYTTNNAGLSGGVKRTTPSLVMSIFPECIWP